jgi:hypothetical protein
MVSVVSSPVWIYVKIETWSTVIVDPVPVVIGRAVPTTFPEAPPEAITEKQVYIDIRINVDTIRLRHCYHGWRCSEWDRWWGGIGIPIFILTPAMVGIGTTIATTKRIVPRNNVFILLPPFLTDKWSLTSTKRFFFSSHC